MSLKSLYLAACFLCVGTSMAQNIPQSSHVWIIAEENHSYEEVVGNSQMPYYNKLIRQYGLAAQFYSDQHSSLPALMWYVAGAAVEKNNDTVSCQHKEDNIVREVLKRGYTWRSYQENLPEAGFQGLYGGPDDTYYRRHNPLADFTDVCPGTGQDKNSVPYPQIETDFAKGDTVNFAFLTPDVDEDAHNGTLEAADGWLQDHLPDILARPEFGPDGDGILFIVWDESESSDDRCSASVAKGCGGRIPNLVLGPHVKAGFRSAVTYHSENVLKTVCEAMGLSTCPGAAKDAAPMADFFKNGSAGGSPSGAVVISSPANGANITGAVHLIATASEGQPVSQMQVWDNGAKLGVHSGTAIDQSFSVAGGSHTIDVFDLDSNFKVLHEATVSFHVQ